MLIPVLPGYNKINTSRVTNIFCHMTWKKVPVKTPSLKPSSWTIRVPDLCGLLYPSQSSRWHLLYSCTFVLLYLLPTFYLPHNPHTASYVPGFFFLSLPKRVQTWLIAVNGVDCCQRHNILLVQGPVQIYISVLDGWGPLRIGLGTTWGLFPCHFPALWGLQVSTCSDTIHTPHM